LEMEILMKEGIHLRFIQYLILYQQY
jgi:hypothetical protein